MGLLLDAGIVVIVLIVVGVVAGMYNGFVVKRNRVNEAWAQIDVQLKRRYDLIPNLVETCKGYMKYEKGVLEKVTQLRSSIVSGSVQDKAQANNALSQTLKSLFAVAENYPDLKANQSFQNLQQELAVTEDRIAFVRTSYNDYVLSFNNAIQTFPGNVLAGMFGFTQMQYFQTPGEEREPVKVSFADSAPSASMGDGGSGSAGTNQPSAPGPASSKGKSSKPGK